MHRSKIFPFPLPYIAPSKRRSLRLLVVVAGSVLVSACVGLSGGPHMMMRTYDLGPEPMAHETPAATSSIAVAEVTTPSWLDTSELQYRLAYADPQQMHPYSQAQWAALPASLITHRLKSSLANTVRVTTPGDTQDETILKVELLEFAQVFDSPTESRARVQMRATILRSGTIVAQRSFALEERCPSADAAGGIRALTLATDRGIAELVQWATPMASARTASSEPRTH